MNYIKSTVKLFFALVLGNFLFSGCVHSSSSNGAPLVIGKKIEGAFSLTDCSILYDKADFSVVEKTVGLLAEDIESVTGFSPVVMTQNAKGNIILIGTIKNNRLIQQLVLEGKLDVSGIENGWEQFTIQRINNPMPDVKQALVIAGSNHRGTAYGAFALSEAMGVSPWVWWADVPVKKQEQIYVVKDTISKAPSIKYRGIFINDEDWGLKPWATNNYEKELGDIGPKTYARVCELLLRLKANMFAPAMHTCTGAFYSHEESKVVADQYGIIVTTSHCEPLLFNNAAHSEWNNERDGEWNYATNKETIQKKLDDRVSEAAAYENIYTMGMRGLHDEGMRGNLSKDEKVKILGQVMIDQREILKKHIDKSIEEIPQIFVPYKETLDLYNSGLHVPDDITLVWTDDNYGYIKRLSNPEEQNRSGGAGVYYHMSYLGAPHDYLWLNTTAPVLMYEELKKACDTGAHKYWLLNVGDIKPTELGMQTFFELAWDFDKFDFEKINHHQSQFLAGIFGTEYEKSFQDILDNFYRLAWSRKPEYMGWEREWDSKEMEKLSDTDFSFQNYNDAQQRLADYQRISDLTYQLLNQLPKEYQPAFFEMLAYPVMGAHQMNRKFLLAQLNHEQFKDNNFAKANWAAIQSRTANDSIYSLTNMYNNLLDGKWKGMMSIPPGFVAKYQNMPELNYQEEEGLSPIDLKPVKSKNKLEGCAIIDLENFKNKKVSNGHTLRLIKGIGYDWMSIQLGEVTQKTMTPNAADGSCFEYEFSGISADSVSVYVYSLPFFPVYTGRSNRYGISVDGQPSIIIKNEPLEYSIPWKDQVLQNGTLAVVKFPVKKEAEKHILSLTCIDPGVIIQRVLIDWGGLKKTYVGPGVNILSDN